MVKLVGQDDTANVHWRRCRHIAGPGITVTQAVQNSALHDLQRFIVDAIDDWGFNEDGSAMLHVQWRGFDETEATWEPLEQLNEDVPEKVAAYVKDIAAPALAEALKKCKPKRKRKGGRSYAAAAAAAASAASANSQVTGHDGPAAAAMASSATANTEGTMTHTEARSARAAARAARNDRRNRNQPTTSKTKRNANRRRRR